MTQPLLAVAGLSKRFPGVVALSDIALDVRPGEVHALVGENGAGKSTLINILTGVYTPDEGTICWEGRPVSVSSPQAARRLGIAVIHQDRQIVPNFTALENMFLGHPYPRRGGGLFVDWPAMRRRAERVMAELGVRVPLDLPARDLSPAVRTIVELLRANLSDCQLLFLDEPTAALTDHEAKALFALIRRLQQRGTAFVYVSHRLEEVLALSDRVTVLRNGQHITTLPASGATQESLVRLMAGEGELPQPGAMPASAAGGAPVLAVTDLETQDGTVAGGSFMLHRGELLGLFGLAGAGRTELQSALYGDRPIARGSILLDGRSVRFRSPADALDAGVVLIPEDRRGHALVMAMNVRENMTLAVLGRHRWGPGFVRRAQEAADVRTLINELGIKVTGTEQGVCELSGGNQQKVVIARSLLRSPRVFLCDEPTQAVDVKTRREIHQMLRRKAAEGAGVLFASSDVGEVLEVCDRVLVMRRGRIVAALDCADATPHSVLQLCYAQEV